MRWLAAPLVVLLVLLLGATAKAQTAANALVEQMVAERAATLASLSRRYESRDQELLARIAARSREIGAALRAANTAERGPMQAELARLTAECAALTERLRASFPDFGADLDAYRAAVTSLAVSPDPRRVAALERYASGDRAGALAVLATLQEAETRAVAAGWREIGALALDMRDRGERTTGQVGTIFSQAQRLDPSHSDATRQLVLLLMEEHRYAEGKAVLAVHQRTSPVALARADALVLQGQLEMEFGENRSARASLREAVGIYQALRSATPNDPALEAQWLEAMVRFISAFGGTYGMSEAERQAYHAERSDIERQLGEAALHAGPYANLSSPRDIFNQTNAACFMGQRIDLGTEFAATLTRRCEEGVAELERRFPGSYFAMRSRLTSAIVRFSGGPPAIAREMPAMIQLATQLIERDPDSVMLISTLGNYMMLYEAMSRTSEQTAQMDSTFGGLRRAIEILEGIDGRGRLSPDSQLRLANFYLMANYISLAPNSGAPYAQRANQLLDRIVAAAPPNAEIRGAAERTRNTWARLPPAETRATNEVRSKQ